MEDPPIESAFAQLARRVQIAQMRRLADMALAAYDLDAPRLRLLTHRHNTTFRVDTAAGQRYVLRIHRTGNPTVESVGAELAWLVALHRDTDLGVPEPVPTRDGALLTVASTSAVPKPHICVLFRWLDGQRVNAGLTPRHMALNGAFMARLQDHAAHFGPPPGFARGRVDRLFVGAPERGDPFSPANVAAAHDLVADTLSAGEAATALGVIERIKAVYQALGRGPATFGLIHADLHQWNLLFAGDTVRAIDFDDCGFGPLLYDLAVPLAQVLDRANYPALRAGLLAGYRRVRSLSAAHEASLDTIIALRQLQDALWVLQYRQELLIRGDWVAQARQLLTPLPAFLATGDWFSQ